MHSALYSILVVSVTCYTFIDFIKTVALYRKRTLVLIVGVLSIEFRLVVSGVVVAVVRGFR